MRDLTPILLEDMQVGLSHVQSPAVAKNEDPVCLPFPIDTTKTLQQMLERFDKNKRTQSVSFRKLVPWLKVGERATHYLHSYPAKLLPQIAHFFLAASQLSKKSDIVLDPFGGTGTVALEAMLAGRKAYYSDVNPLAQLIAKVKTSPLSLAEIDNGFKRIEKKYLLAYGTDIKPPSVVNINHWYTPEIIRQLTALKNVVESEKREEIRDYFRICFSLVCRKVSNADPRLSVPVLAKGLDLNSPRYGAAWDAFVAQSASNRKRMKELAALSLSAGSASFVGNDARKLYSPTNSLASPPRRLRAGSISLIITSPPYAGAQKYIRASSLSLGWLGLAGEGELKGLENASIGREHLPKKACIECPKTGIPNADSLLKKIFKINPSRSAIAATYINEMRAAITEMARVLKPGGFLVLVIGNNEVCGLPFESSKYLEIICAENNLNIKLRLVDEIKSRGLMTKRNKSASIISREWVLLFEKGRA